MTTPVLGFREALAVLDGCTGRLTGRERHEILRLAGGDRRALVALHQAVLRGTRRADGSRIPDTTAIQAAAGLGELSEAQRSAALALPGDTIKFEDPLVRVAARHAMPLVERRRRFGELAVAAADPVRAAWYRSQAGDGDPARRIADLTLVALSGQSWADAVRCWEKAAELAPDPAAGARHLLFAAIAALGTAEPARVAWLCRRLAAATSDPELLAAGTAVTAIALDRCGATDAAATVLPGERRWPALAAFTAQLPAPIGLHAEAVTARIDDLVDAARWDEARTLIDELEEHAAIGRWSRIQVDLVALRATVRALRGEPGTLGRIWQMIDLAENPASHVRLLRAEASAATAAGDWAGAYRHLRAMFTASGAPVHAELSVRCVADLATAAVRCGRHGEAAGIVQALDLTPPTGTRLRLRLHRAAALTGDHDTEQHHRLAVIDPAGEQWPLERALGRLHYGQWLRRRRRPTEARDLVHAALETFDRLGAVPYAEMARTELRAGGHVPDQDRPAAGPDPLGVLTPQERQVVVLAAGGLPNRAIAEQLLISARTVGSHLYKAYPKLGVDGRHRLAGLISQGATFLRAAVRPEGGL